MSALTDLFTAMANKIRSKTGTATTYTPSEMVSDGIDDVYDAGVASATTPITPSNSSPASMTANTGYKPTANGYAIASYSSVTPSSTQTAVSSGDIVKIGGSGVIVDTVPPTPTSITPSNSSPVALTANTPVNPTSSGYAIYGYTGLVPSNISPVPLAGRQIYKITYGTATQIEGYAIESYYTVNLPTTNRAYAIPSVSSLNKIIDFCYAYGAKPTGRYLFSYTTQPNRDSTSWYTVGFSSASTTVYDADGTSFTIMLDENFAHFADGGEIVVDRACTIYIAGYAWYGRTSSGTVVYSGVRVLLNGSVISGASVMGESGSASPSFRRVEASVAVGDVLKIQTKVSSTSSANSKITVNICTD